MSSQAKSTKSLPMFFTVFYTVVILLSLTLTNKIIDIHGYLISGCLIVFPLIFFLGDIVAEIYGYLLAQRIILLTVVGAAIFSVIITLINLTIVSYVVKMLYAAVAAVPATYIVNYIKHVKGTDYMEKSVDFNPFKVL